MRAVKAVARLGTNSTGNQGNDFTRREMLRGTLGAAALMGVGVGVPACGSSTDGSTDLSESEFGLSGRPKEAVGIDTRMPILWIEAGVCTGCSCSLLGSTDPTVESVLPQLRLEYQETLMDNYGPNAVDRLLAMSAAESGHYLLIVDGSIPSGALASTTTLGVTSAGQELTAQDLVTDLALRALAVVALGTCSAFGGIPSAPPNPGGNQPLASFVPAGKPLVRIPGCPPHPGWILETLAAVLTHGVAGLSLDSKGRPLSAFGPTIHDLCSRRAHYDDGDFADAPGDPTRCLVTVGCRGPETHADCPRRPWAGRSSCIDANHPCIGCAAPGFPDSGEDSPAAGARTVLPFYPGL